MENDELREIVASSLLKPRTTEYSRIAGSSLRLAYNNLAPERFRIADTSRDSLQISANRQPLDSRDLTTVIHHFSSAIASIGREIREPSKQASRLTRIDYDRAPIFTEVHGDGAQIVLRPGASALAMGAEPIDQLSAQAFDRLTNLLPESADDQASIQLALGAQTTSRRALREVALAASRVGGVSVTLHRRTSVTNASLSLSQAAEIRSQLELDERRVDKIYREGVLDGVRSRRRLFYLEVSGGPTIEGIIDESLVDAVFNHLTQRVSAAIERTQVTSKAGVVGRPGYRLVGLTSPDTDLPFS